MNLGYIQYIYLPKVYCGFLIDEDWATADFYLSEKAEQIPGVSNTPDPTPGNGPLVELQHSLLVSKTICKCS